MRVPGLLRRRRVQLLLGAGAVLVVVIAAVVASDDDEETVVVADDGTTTTEPTTTTEEPTTTSTTTTVPPTTATTAAPTTTTAAPPPTTPVPATFDRFELLAWAKAHPGAGAPYMYSGSSCEVGSEAYDHGDDADGDLRNPELVRDCDASFRAFMSSDMELPSYAWIEIDARSGGCEQVDVVAVVWNGSSIGSVVSTPTCDPSSWSTAGGTASRHPHIFDFGGGTFGDPASFRWRGGLLGSPADTKIDLAPSGGFTAFQR